MAKTCLVDTPILSQNDDRMGIDLYVEALADVIADADTPLTVAIRGEWGSGKTSFMNQLSEKLCSPFGGRGSTSPYFGIWIHAWEFALLKEPTDILVSLMKGLIREMSREVEKVSPNDSTTKEFCRTALDIAQRFTKTAFYVAAARLGGLAATGAIEKMMNGSENVEEQEASIGELKTALKNAVEASLASAPQKKGFIFFIDDLDRLDPVIAVNFLELVKNLFDLPDCIFVLAIDYDVVVRGLTPRFGPKTDENAREFRSFFDKIIQLPFNVPVSSYDLGNYLKGSLEHIGFMNAFELDVCIPMGRWSYPVQSITTESFAPQKTAFEILCTVTEKTVGSNPRSIKRLMNTLSLLSKIYAKKYLLEQNACNDIDPSRITEKIILYCLVSMEIAYQPIYDCLTHYPGFPSWDTDNLKEWGYATNLEDWVKTQGHNKKDKDTTADVENMDEDINEGFDYEDAIDVVSMNDSFLRARKFHIQDLFTIIYGIILLSNYKNLFDVNSLDNSELLDEWNDMEQLYNHIYSEPDEEEDVVDDPDDQDTDSELYKEKNKLVCLLNDIILRALEKFLALSSSTSIAAPSEHSPERTAAPRQKREYNKVESFSSYEEYAEGAGEQFLELLGQLDELLDETFPEMLEYEYKDDIKKTINIRPINKKKKKGSPVLLSITMLKNKGLSMRVECGGFFKKDLSDSTEPLLEHMDDIVERFHELSTDVLEDAE